MWNQQHNLLKSFLQQNAAYLTKNENDGSTVFL